MSYDEPYQDPVEEIERDARARLNKTTPGCVFCGRHLCGSCARCTTCHHHRDGCAEKQIERPNTE